MVGARARRSRPGSGAALSAGRPRLRRRPKAAVPAATTMITARRPQAEDREGVGGEHHDRSLVTPNTAGIESSANTRSVASTATSATSRRPRRASSSLCGLHRSPGSGRLGVAARAVPGLGDGGEQPGRDRRSAQLASAETAGRQAAESFLEIGQFPARSDRPAEQPLSLLLACGVTSAFGIGGVIGQ